MRLDEHWTVEPDTRCWTLTYKAPTGKISEKTGDPTFSTDQTYHANLKQALVVYLDKCLEPSTDIEDVIRRIQEAEDRINQMA